MKNNAALVDFFTHLDRSYFMDINKDLAHLDTALAIGHGQTISQPSLVLFMIQELDLNKDHKVLEIGTGSGYQTAFLGEFADEIITIERIDPLRVRARERLNALGYDNIQYILGDGTDGYAPGAPYDRIIVSAAAKTVPGAYIDQLATDGIIIIPVGDKYVQNLIKVTKDTLGQIHETSLEKVRFVPLVGKYQI